ncbi:uncharacterized protein [Fopius arisanus]|uniref:Uncharacterized protein n=1 Tax=Fopius arisanus TaxID=64838 RepID=A0A9R1U9K3_9HYME|nr:PREDICTED: uncharacterized protein LOC105272822 [Fopius arisanus]
MLALCLFTNDFLYICKLQEVFVRGKEYSVKHSDNKKYVTRVLAISQNEPFLSKFKSNIEGGARKEIEGYLTLEHDRLMSYSQVSKTVIEHADDFIFADKSICSDINGDSGIRV